MHSDNITVDTDYVSMIEKLRIAIYYDNVMLIECFASLDRKLKQSYVNLLRLSESEARWWYQE